MSRIKIEELSVLTALGATEIKFVRGGSPSVETQFAAATDDSTGDGETRTASFGNYRPQFYFR